MAFGKKLGDDENTIDCEQFYDKDGSYVKKCITSSTTNGRRFNSEQSHCWIKYSAEGTPRQRKFYGM